MDEGQGSGPDRAAIRAHYGAPTPRSQVKQLDRIDGHARAFIALSPFCVVASADEIGRASCRERV